MKIFMTGGTGFVGRTLTKTLTEKGHQVTVLTRDITKGPSLPKGATHLEGNPTEEGTWQEKVAEHEAVINLAGASAFRRWTTLAKEAIRESRLMTTQNLVDALSARKEKEILLLSTSAVGYYGFHGDEDLDEESPPSDDFFGSLCQAWESSALRAEAYGVRVVLLRFGLVLGISGGALRQMIPLYNRFLGSPLGSGQQWFSWIHEQDLANIYLYLLEQKEVAGPVNCTAPKPVRNEELTKALGEVLGKPTFMPAVPGFILNLILGEFGSVVLKGQKVLPRRLLDMGFRFGFPEIKGALNDLIS
jgi:uncharacterized protein (TIGR01777 family)